MKTIITLLTISVAATAFAQICDLTLSGGTISPNPCTLSGTLVLQVTVHNNSTFACQDLHVEFFLSPDSSFDEDECRLGDSTIAIAGGGTVTARKTISPLSSVMCATTGRFYILAVEQAGPVHLRVFPVNLVIWPSANGSYACQGTGVLNNHQEHVDAYFNGSNYFLKDQTRRANNNIHGHNGNMVSTGYIQTQSYATGTALDITDIDGTFDSGVQCPGIDAEVYGGLTYDYMWHVLGRNGPDNGQAQSNPNRQLMYVENSDAFNGAHNHVNAPYSPGYVCFGSHDTLRKSMAGAIEIVGHEWGHTVTGFESDLTYYAESGSLNDSWSDCLGIAIAFWSSVDPDWQDGEDVWANGLPLRDLQNPHSVWDDRHEGGWFPDIYHGDGWYYGDEDGQGIHHNGTVFGHFFYLLSVGGQGNGVTVQGVGIDTAMTILYHANRDFWTPSTDFANAREGCISAAAEMDSTYAYAVMDAWAAVGVGNPAPLHAPARLTIRPALNGNDALLRWSSTPNTASYRIYAGDSLNFPRDTAHFIASTADTTYIHTSGLTPPRRYYIVVSSTDAP